MKKNAFTLIELIATIGLLGLLATITITISVRKINETKESARDTMFESIELAAEKYVNDNEEDLSQFKNNDNIYISLQTLVEKEYFTESLIDPTTKKSLPLSNEIYVIREENGKIKAKYNINQRTEPKLTLKGSYNEYLELGKEYQELGVTAIKEGIDVSSNVTIIGTVDNKVPDTYKITYELDNVKITRNVIVYDGNLSTKEFYKLTVDLDGGIDNVDYQTRYEAGTIIKLEEPTKDGYTFIEWTLVTGESSIVDNNTLLIGKMNTKIKATWEENIVSCSKPLKEVTVNNENELKEALLYDGSINITLTSEINVLDTNSLVSLCNVNLNMYGYPINGNVSGDALIKNYGTLNISNGDIYNNNVLAENSHTILNLCETTIELGQKKYKYKYQNSCKLDINSSSIGSEYTRGAAIYNKGGTVTLSDSTFMIYENNETILNNSYVIMNYSGNITLNSCFIMGNVNGILYSSSGVINSNESNLIIGDGLADTWYIANAENEATINLNSCHIEWNTKNAESMFKGNVFVDGMLYE